MDLSELKAKIRDIKDFPTEGILFKDITTLLRDPRAFKYVLDELATAYIQSRVEIVVGIESRGFIFCGALAARLNASFVPVRKPGKLPYKTSRVAYKLEYGEAELEMHEGSIRRGASVLIVDDLLATGGTASAAAALAARQEGNVKGFAFVVELDFLDGRRRLREGGNAKADVFSILHFGAGE